MAIPNRIKGFRFSCTGRLDDWTRLQLHELISRYGGELVKKAESIDSVDCLIHGNVISSKKTTEKLRIAKKVGVPRISEDEFKKILVLERRKRNRRVKH